MKYFCFVSAARPNRSEESIRRSHAQLCADVLMRGYRYTNTCGKFCGIREPSIMLLIEEIDFAYIEKLCTRFSQDCALVVECDNVRRAYLLYTDGLMFKLGRMVPGNANPQTDYTLIGNTFYSIENEQESIS